MTSVRAILDRALRRAGRANVAGAPGVVSALPMAGLIARALERGALIALGETPSSAMQADALTEANALLASLPADGLAVTTALGADYVHAPLTATDLFPLSAAFEDAVATMLAARLVAMQQDEPVSGLAEDVPQARARLQAAFYPRTHALDELNALLSGFEADGLVLTDANGQPYTHTPLALTDTFPLGQEHEDGVSWLVAANLTDLDAMGARKARVARRRIGAAFAQRTRSAMPKTLQRLNARRRDGTFLS